MRSSSEFGRRLAFAVLFLTVIGCGGPAVKPIDNDPLLGPGSTKQLPKAPTEKEKKASVARPGPSSAEDLRRQLNELPVPSPTTSNAELASGRAPTLDTAPRLQLGDTGTAVVTPPVEVANVRATGNGAGMTLESPVPLSEPRFGPAPTPAAVGTLTPDQERQLQAPYQQLDAKGAFSKELKYLPAEGKWQFVCILLDRKTNKAPCYEYRSADPLNAVRLVLDAITKDGF